MKKIISTVLLSVLVVAMVAAGAFVYGRSYEREHYECVFTLTESEKDMLRASFLASGAEQINDDLFKISWSEKGGEHHTSYCELNGSASEEIAKKVLILTTELSVYLDTRPEGRELTKEFISSDSCRIPE